MLSLFVDTYFENASPLDVEIRDDAIEFFPLADNERFTGNRQTTHWNFKVHVAPECVGRTVRLRLRDKTTVWNGQRVPAFGDERLASVVSRDGGIRWEGIAFRKSDLPGIAGELDLVLDRETIQVAHTVPYTEKDYLRLLDRVKEHPRVRVETIGTTVEGRSLDVISIGDPDRPSVFFRGRAHPWESGGSWLLEGLIGWLLSGCPEAAAALDRISFDLLPMAARDGVVRGMTRFTVAGFDLNRGWGRDREFDPIRCPENACLLAWLEKRRSENRLPFLALDLHNDQQGCLHRSHPEPDGGYAARIGRFEQSLRRHTWFTEGFPPGSFRNPGSIAEGLMERFEMDAAIWELNASWAAGLNRIPLAADWMSMGAQTVPALLEYALEKGRAPRRKSGV